MRSGRTEKSDVSDTNKGEPRQKEEDVVNVNKTLASKFQVFLSTHSPFNYTNSFLLPHKSLLNK